MYKFHLVIDGCNGPIRFRDKKLLKVSNEKREDRPESEDALCPPEASADDDVILSFLRPESIGCRSSSGYCKKGKKSKMPNRLDMIPLLHKLVSREPHRFNSVRVIFDGNSITKRHLRNRNEIAGEMLEDDIANGSLWDVQTNKIASKICRPVREQLPTTGGNLTIEITGLYDEADNAIVDTVEALRKQRSKSPEMTSTSKASTCIRTVRRTDRGAGKNRRLYQALGLLRPDSIACMYDFSSSDDGQESTLFPRITMDSRRTLTNLLKNNPGNVFFVLDDPWTANHGSNDIDSAIIPIVATDDVFLRQRIVHEGGYVMTFHQLWLLLMDL